MLPQRPDSADAEPSSVPQEMKNSFLKWLAADTGLKDFEITEELGGTFEDLFADIEGELGRIDAPDLDPRYVQLFLLT